MNRILIIGCSGGGKSTLARAIGVKLALPVFHLDKLWWQPGWVELGHEIFRPLVRNLVAEERWVIDGNYSDTWDIRMPRADMIIWVDLPRRVCLWRVFRRAVTQLGTVRSDMARGCPERLDLEFFLYVWSFRKKNEKRIEAALREYGQDARIIRVRSDSEAAVLLTRV